MGDDEGGGGPLAVSYGSQSPHFAQCPGKYWLSISQVRVQIEEAWDVKHRGRGLGEGGGGEGGDSGVSGDGGGGEGGGSGGGGDGGGGDSDSG